MSPSPKDALRSGLFTLLKFDLKTLATRAARITLGVMAVAALARAVGFVIPLFIARLYGVNRSTDAFFLVYGSAAFFIVIVADLAEAVLVPVIAESLAADGTSAAAQITRRGIRYANSIAASCYLLGLGVFAAIVSEAGGSNSPDRFPWPLAFRMYAWCGPMLMLAVTSAVLSAAMLARGAFLVPALAPGVRGLVTISILYLSRERSAGAPLMLAYTAGEAVRFATILVAAGGRGPMSGGLGRVPYLPARRALRQVVLFQVLALTMASINPLVSRYAATYLGAGSVTLVEIGEKVFWVPMTLFYAGISTVGLSYWSNTFYSEGRHAARTKIRTSLAVTFWGGITCTVVVVAASERLVRMILSDATLATLGIESVTAVVRLYAAGILPYALLMVVSRSLLVLRDTRALFLAGFAGSLSNVALLLIFTPRLHVQGIALSTSLTSVVGLSIAGTIAYRAWRRHDPVSI